MSVRSALILAGVALTAGACKDSFDDVRCVRPCADIAGSSAMGGASGGGSAGHGGASGSLASGGTAGSAGAGAAGKGGGGAAGKGGAGGAGAGGISGAGGAGSGGLAGKGGSAGLGGTGGLSGSAGIAGSGGSAGMAGCTPGMSICEAGSVRTCDMSGTLGMPVSCALGCAAGACVQVKSLTLGGAHSCALLTDGSVRCWGANDSGQLGIGSTGAAVAKPTPISGLTASALAAGLAHTCAIRSDQSVVCWGKSTSGQVGMVGTTLSSPGVVPTVMGATLLAAGANHTCAGGASGVSCWGDDSAGQTGGGAMGTPVSPSAVVGATSATALTAGAERTCLVANQGVSCWGGQGFSAATGQVDASPTIVNGLDGATTIAAGRFHLCSLGAGSVVSCVGRNDEGQLGVGTSGSSTSTTTPSLVGGLSGVTRVASGDLHTCALVGSGAVYCWGDASRGQLGEGTSGTGMLLSSPTLVTGLIGKAVSTGGFHSCAITSSSKVVCWGANDQAQLGDSTGADHATPVEVAF